MENVMHTEYDSHEARGLIGQAEAALSSIRDRVGSDAGADSATQADLVTAVEAMSKIIGWLVELHNQYPPVPHALQDLIGEIEKSSGRQGLG